MIALSDSIVGANAGRSRGHNRQVVLGRIRSADRIGRADIAKASGLSTQAVSNIIADLLDDGLIIEQGHRSASRGMPVAQYSLNPMGGVSVGVEIRPDAVFGCVLNLSGDAVVEHRNQIMTTDRPGVVRAVKDMRDAVLDRAGVSTDRLLGVGVVMPGPFGCTGIAEGASELPIWDDTPAEVWVSDMLGMPVLIENDANAAAIAERVSGVAKGMRSYAFVYFGSGLGLGIVNDGKLTAGAFGNAGEIGTLQVPSDGKLVMLEDAVSRRSLATALQTLDVPPTVEGLSDLYEARDEVMMKWLVAATEPLSAAISTVENLLDPETIILGGAMPDNILDHLVRSIRLTDRSVSNRANRAAPRVMRGASGRMTATLGAAALVLNHAFTPKIAPQPQEL